MSDAHYVGRLLIQPPLNEAEQKALGAFLSARHVQTVHGPLDVRKSLSMGHQDVQDWNNPPKDVPSLYCGLKVGSDGATLEWDGEEKPGDLTEWVRYLVDHFLRPGAAFSELARMVPENDLLYNFTFDHEVSGTLVGTTTQGERWEISVSGNRILRNEIPEQADQAEPGAKGAA